AAEAGREEARRRASGRSSRVAARALPVWSTEKVDPTIASLEIRFQLIAASFDCGMPRSVVILSFADVETLQFFHHCTHPHLFPSFGVVAKRRYATRTGASGDP